ncbi:hypothetical protein E2C01_021423 [Portunus trituberculatus]|uniref:Uncharacterized protein n=1 Tax=Portunus trituberculatus TaxID=210409 RepID=A0A5B7E4C5_PORTR|nr:hypothetical protein [Portunus trituberculatus]
MPSTCCVPYCKGNCKTGPRVSVYRFPEQPELRYKPSGGNISLQLITAGLVSPIDTKASN